MKMNYVQYPKYTSLKHMNCQNVSRAYIPTKRCNGTNISGFSRVAFETSCSRGRHSKKLTINSRQATMFITNLTWFSWEQ